ncbi:hypothetical protein AN958_02873 [Leucoagaricus sp. SymC.cos]|nr:hypothetical protein AN958_02873 [Leucoagaricus sp. SymC.cos]
MSDSDYGNHGDYDDADEYGDYYNEYDSGNDFVAHDEESPHASPGSSYDHDDSYRDEVEESCDEESSGEELSFDKRKIDSEGEWSPSDELEGPLSGSDFEDEDDLWDTDEEESFGEREGRIPAHKDNDSDSSDDTWFQSTPVSGGEQSNQAVAGSPAATRGNEILENPNAPTTSSSPSRREVWKLIESVLNYKEGLRKLVRAKGARAQTLLDTLQKVLDDGSIPNVLRRKVPRVLSRLCARSQIYPSCLSLVDVNYERNPVTSGSFGDIWKGYYQGKAVCLKVPKIYQRDNHATQSFIKAYAREAILWCYISHPNLLPFYGIYLLEESIGCVCLVSPWMENGNITEYLRNKPEIPRRPLVQETLEGLVFLHKNKVVHGDIKGGNILIQENGSACLADFGLSCVVDEEILQWTSSQTTARIGTLRWQAPELVDESTQTPTFKSDIYSMASTMYEVLTGHTPYYECYRDFTVVGMLVKGITPKKPSPMEMETLELTDLIWQLMTNCWSRVPDERPTVEEVIGQLQHIPPNLVTIQRTALLAHSQVDKIESTFKVPTGSFRSSMRRQEARYTEVEVETLKKYIPPSPTELAGGKGVAFAISEQDNLFKGESQGVGSSA